MFILSSREDLEPLKKTKGEMSDSGRLLKPSRQPRTNGKSVGHWNNCDCCPYGYHIDVEFVKYAEEIGAAGGQQQPTSRPLREERRVKRRSRQFAEEKRSNGQGGGNSYYGESQKVTRLIKLVADD